MIRSNDDRTILVLELVRRDVNEEFAAPKPRMTLPSTLAKIIVKVAAALLCKIYREELGSLTTSAAGELTHWKPGQVGFRVILHNCHQRRAETARKIFKVQYFKIHEREGEVLVSGRYPMDVERCLTMLGAND